MAKMSQISFLAIALVFIVNCQQHSGDVGRKEPVKDLQAHCRMIQESMPQIEGQNLKDFTFRVIELASRFPNLKLQETASCLDQVFSIICENHENHEKHEKHEKQSCRMERK